MAAPDRLMISRVQSSIACKAVPSFGPDQQAGGVGQDRAFAAFDTFPLLLAPNPDAFAGPVVRRGGEAAFHRIPPVSLKPGQPVGGTAVRILPFLHALSV